MSRASILEGYISALKSTLPSNNTHISELELHFPWKTSEIDAAAMDLDLIQCLLLFAKNAASHMGNRFNLRGLSFARSKLHVLQSELLKQLLNTVFTRLLGQSPLCSVNARN